MTVVRCPLSVDNRRLKRQQKTIFPIITLFTFAEQQPQGYEWRATRSEQLLKAHSSKPIAKKISF